MFILTHQLCPTSAEQARHETYPAAAAQWTRNSGRRQLVCKWHHDETQRQLACTWHSRGAK